MTHIRRVLPDSNEWWKGEFELEYHERDILGHVSKFLPLPQIIAFTGLRRVGKTTLMFKIASDFIDGGLDPKNVIYFSFDDFRDAQVSEVIREYEELMGKNIKEGKYLLLLDEIQKLTNWEDQVKRIYDIYGKRVKIILSGSESLFLRKKSKETLSGRIFEFKVNTLSFREFLRFNETEFQPVELYERELAELFQQFIQTQGFPELVGIGDREIILKYIRESIIEKIVYRDISQLFKVRDVGVLDSLLKIIIDRPGQLVDISDLGKELNVSRQSVSNYLMYLQESFLVRKLYNFSTNRRKTERKLKKYYSTLLLDAVFEEDKLSRSRVFEWLMVNHLGAEFFWRDSYKHEVDVVIADEKVVPVEIKAGKTETKGLVTFMEKFGVDKGYIVTPDREERLEGRGKVIEVVKGYKFLMDEWDGFRF